jgi:hypothetical protein
MPTKHAAEEISPDFTVKLWGAKARPWGYEVRVDLIDPASGRIYNEVLTFTDKAAAVGKDRNAAVQQVQERIRAQAAAAAAQANSPPVCALCGRPL